MDPVRIVLESGESLTVRLVDGVVEIAREDRWLQRLTREEAWQLAEVLDDVATAAADD